MLHPRDGDGNLEDKVIFRGITFAHEIQNGSLAGTDTVHHEKRPRSTLKTELLFYAIDGSLRIIS